uniref:Ceramide synthase 2 n=1 Tax=Piliocolobus tephrosceles TaxID=591936 RepID=A0A8C9II34_9PRIM
RAWAWLRARERRAGVPAPAPGRRGSRRATARPALPSRPRPASRPLRCSRPFFPGWARAQLDWARRAAAAGGGGRARAGAGRRAGGRGRRGAGSQASGPRSSHPSRRITRSSGPGPARSAAEYVATPLAALLNIKEKTRLRAPPNATLEHFYLTSGKQPKQVEVELLSRQSGLSGRQVERWFRRRRNQDRPSLLKKFREASWRFTFYLIAFIAGMAVIVDKPWFYDMKKVWEGYPIQDFKEQIIHHVATIILISFSWFANYIRAGTLIMALHDSSDYLLESAKMFNYAGWKNTCNNIFIIFAIVFIITRLVILPFWILHCTLVYPLELYPAFFGYYFFNSMMGVLQLLHIFWAYLILRMAHKFITGKQVEDERSDREETESSEGEEAAAGGGAKSRPLANGHPILNNHHRAGGRS